MINQLDLRDVILVAPSFGVVEAAIHYRGASPQRGRKLIALAAVGPCMLATSDNPFGVGELLYPERETAAVPDRYAAVS